MPSLPLEGIRMELFGDDSGVDALHWNSRGYCMSPCDIEPPRSASHAQRGS